MMISMTPLKLLNLAQLAIIGKLLLNKHAITEVPDDGLDKAAQQKTKGNVMIFLGKHTIQLSPNSVDRSGHTSSPARDTNVTNNSGIEWQHQAGNKPPLTKQNRYLSHHSPSRIGAGGGGGGRLSPFGERVSVQSSKKILSRSHEPSRKQNIFYLPYSKTNSNSIQFFDFDHRYFITNTSTSTSTSSTPNSSTEQSAVSQSGAQMWPSLSRLLGKSPLLASQSSEVEQTTETGKLTDGELLVANWFKKVFDKQQSSNEYDDKIDHTFNSDSQTSV